MPSDTSTSGTERKLEAGKRRGVHLLKVEKARVGYLVKSDKDTALVDDVTVHGGYIGTSDYFETECIDFEITEDGTLDLRYTQPGTERSDTGRKEECDK